MSFKINLSKGFDINLIGEAVKTITTIKPPSSFAIKPTDFIGITRPKLLKNVGDEVKAGTPILFDKLSDQVMYCSPVSGEIIEVVRGLKRRIEEIRILPDKKNIYVKNKKFSSLEIDQFRKEDIIKSRLFLQYNENLVGELNIGITDNLVTSEQMRITRSLSSLKHRAPDVVINIRMIPPNDIESAVLNGKLHIGVVPEFRTLPGLNYIHLYKEQSLLYCSEQHPLFQQELDVISDDALIQYDAVVPSYPQSAEIKQQQKKLRATASSTDREGIAFLILTGRFIGFLPTHFAQRWTRQDSMRAIESHSRIFHTNFSTITSKGARSNLILDAYMEELKKTVEY